MMSTASPHPAGLSAAEAAHRLASDGPNELPRAAGRSVFRIAIDVLREPMLLLLLVGGVVYFLLGERIEAVVLLLLATLSVAITVVQEARSERVLEALRDLSAPRALVIRDGESVRVAGREVVRDDLLVLEQGDRVAADALLLIASDLHADESLLTGESLHVRKEAAGDNLPDRRPGGDGQPYVYSGSMITRGNGMARVVATGAASEMGRIGQSLADVGAASPRLRKETLTIIRACAAAGILVSLLVILLYGLTRGSWLDAMLAGIAIGMSVLPEEFAVVLAVFMAMGAWRIAQAGVLTRRAAAIETLGSATVLCTDKTGTLTENRMEVARLWVPGAGWAEPADIVDERFHPILEASVMASAVSPVDPMEVAIHAAGSGAVGRHGNGRTLARGYALQPGQLSVTNVWDDEDDRIVAAKGAPETIASLCRLGAHEHGAMTQAVDEMAGRGMRVIGVAIAHHPLGPLPDSQKDFDFRLLGLVGLADPLRATVPDAIEQCHQAGIKVVMITGDYPATARFIAAQAGIRDGELLTGDEVAALDDDALAKRIGSATVFARIMPEQKLRLVQAFRRKGGVVAMTGDGVNDAPSLKAADIGIAMGKRGTDVAREASTLVLLDDDFGSIVKAIRLGRRIYDNIRKAMAFIFAVHVPIAGLALLPLLLGKPLLLGPIHIALLEMIIDPVCALVFEAERDERGVMRRPPRDPHEPLFSRRMVGWSLAQGLVALGLLASTWWIAMKQGLPEDEVRGVVFFALVGSVLALIVANLASGPRPGGRINRSLLFVFAVVGGMLLLAYLSAPVRAVLNIGPLHPADVAAVAAVALLLTALLAGLRRVVVPMPLPDQSR